MSTAPSGCTCQSGAQASCDACAGLASKVPLPPENRPGLSALAYRAGRQSDFFASMLAGLSRADRPALAGLRTRSADDFTIALLDSWACTLDVITFYQERIANEGYLRTATERTSLVELSAALGRELAPAVAADVPLAFTLETATGAPAAITIPEGTRAQSVPEQDGLPQTFETTKELAARGAWNELVPRRKQAIVLQDAISIEIDGVRPDLRPGDGLLLVGLSRYLSPSSDKWAFRTITLVSPHPEKGTTTLSFDTKVSAPEAVFTTHVLRRRAAAFGARAVDFRMLSKDVKTAYGSPEGSVWPDFKISKVINASTFPLDAAYPKVVDGGFIVLSAPGKSSALHRIQSASERGAAAFGMSGQITALELSPTGYTVFDDLVRETTVHCESEVVGRALATITDPIGGATKKEIELDSLVTDLPKDRMLIVAGKTSSGEQRAEVATLESTKTVSGRTVLTLKEPLSGSYLPAETVIYGNVAPARHGETVPPEVLGSGDTSAAFQRFSLRQTPLTRVTDSRPEGFSSTLKVLVDGIAWKEVPHFHGRGPNERVYITRTDEQDRTTVLFGDGREGARLPSGLENVRAEYKKSAGAAGNASPGQIRLLLTRPPGLRAVHNPIAASGGVDRESLEDARTRGPLSVITLDRVVSLEDYASFARGFYGIAKARATWVWDRDRRGVLVTVAGPSGAAIQKGSKVETSLRDAMIAASDPFVPVYINSYQPITFGIQLRVKVKKEEGYQAPLVLESVRAALTARFSFEERALGQNVAQSEVISAAARVPGVAWVDLDTFFRHDGQILAGFEGRYLPCRAPKDGDDITLASAAPAELLTLDLQAAPPSSVSEV